MNEIKPKHTARRISRLDMAVVLVVLLLTAGTLVAAYFGSPERAGALVAYLYPAYGDVQNIWLAPVNNPKDAVQVTNAAGGIYNFGVSADGRFIAYAERDVNTGLSEIFLLDLPSRQVQKLTNCAAEKYDCRTPEFRPGGGVIAYERMQAPEGSFGPGAIRIWLLDISQQPYTTRPLSDDSQFIGHSPQWSQSGDTLAFYSADIVNPGIMVYNFVPADGEKSLKLIPANNGIVGTLSPNGRKLVFPDVVQREQGIITILKIADLDALKFLPLTGDSEPVEDTGADWHPDGQRLAIERRYNDDRYTRGFQIYLLDPETGQVEPLSVDDRYSHGYFEWNSTGDKLVFQRFALVDIGAVPASEAKPEVWVKDMTTGEMIEVANNAFHPRFVLP